MKSGIYSITNIVNNKKYIGQSININSRISAHKTHLKNNKHSNEYLQNQYNKYGIQNFLFEVVEYVDIDKLDEREVYWIEKFSTMDRSKGYNLESGGNTNKIISDEAREKKIGKNNPMYGKKHSKEFVEMIKLRNRGSSELLTEQDVSDIKQSVLKGIQQKELALKYNVKTSTISKIVRCANWEWVDSHLNTSLYHYHDNLKKDRDRKIVELYNKGMSRLSISKEIKCDISTVSRVLKSKAGCDYNKDLKNRNIGIKRDFDNGMSKEDIIEKYNITRKVCNNVLRQMSQVNTEVTN